ncbi:cell division protein ZapA [Hydrogenophaga sp.]|uniref:cell division protein ZapA n=1 Tax=Hydrogenophaga sp. TaxID=1904254 RepID=UPI0019A4E1AC|nr:cell division protein ZapA [Hydrogenophaga sp.]MBD3894042.1 cell division protein ZapA [Hydrogenophaga sp.]
MKNTAANQLEVQIMGQNYLLTCPNGGESALLDAVERVDTAMCRIRDAGKVKARERIAVLASLNLAFELSLKEAENLQITSFGQTEPAALDDTRAAPRPQDALTRTRLDELMRRLDHTLGDDGQLL